MKYNHQEVHSIIDEVVLHHMNEQQDLFGNPKEVVTKESMYSKRRKKELVVSRQLNQYISDYIFNKVLDIKLTLLMNGYRFGTDHVTVHHSRKTIKLLYGSDTQILYMVCSIIDAVVRRIKEDEGSQQAHRWYGWLYPQSNIF